LAEAAVAVAVTKLIAVETPTVVAVPKVVATSVSVADQVAVQVSAPAAKVDSTPASVETAQQLYGSKDSAVKAPLAAESRTEELVTAPNERSKWYVTGGVIKSNLSSYSVASTCSPATCIVGVNDWGVSIGAGYELNKNFLIEGSVSSLGNYSVDWPYGTNVSIGYYSLKLGGIYSYKVSDKVNILVGGGFSTIDAQIHCSGNNVSCPSSLTADRSYITTGASYRLTDDVALRLTWSRIELGLLENFGLDALEVALKYNF
jgi:hypothetical protein